MNVDDENASEMDALLAPLAAYLRGGGTHGSCDSPRVYAADGAFRMLDNFTSRLAEDLLAGVPAQPPEFLSLAHALAGSVSPTDVVAASLACFGAFARKIDGGAVAEALVSAGVVEAAVAAFARLPPPAAAGTPGVPVSLDTLTAYLLPAHLLGVIGALCPSGSLQARVRRAADAAGLAPPPDLTPVFDELESVIPESEAQGHAYARLELAVCGGAAAAVAALPRLLPLVLGALSGPGAGTDGIVSSRGCVSRLLVPLVALSGSEPFCAAFAWGGGVAAIGCILATSGDAIMKGYQLLTLAGLTGPTAKAAVHSLLGDPASLDGLLGLIRGNHRWATDAVAALVTDGLLTGPGGVRAGLLATLVELLAAAAQSGTRSRTRAMTQVLTESVTQAVSSAAELEMADAPAAAEPPGMATIRLPPALATIRLPPRPSPGGRSSLELLSPRHRLGLAGLADLALAVIAALAPKLDAAIDAAAADAAADGLLAAVASGGWAEGPEGPGRGTGTGAAAAALGELGRSRRQRPRIVARLAEMLAAPEAGARAAAAAAAFHMAGRPGTKPEMEATLGPLVDLLQGAPGLSPANAAAAAVATGALLRLATHPPYKAMLKASQLPGYLPGLRGQRLEPWAEKTVDALATSLGLGNHGLESLTPRGHGQRGLRSGGVTPRGDLPGGGSPGGGPLPHAVASPHGLSRLSLESVGGTPRAEPGAVSGV